MPVVAVRLLFAATTFVAAALVFLVQPMVAKQLLPTFGGTPSVWNTCVVFFQVALLVGYAIAHVSLRLLAPRRQLLVQLGLALAALAFLPFALREDTSIPDGVPPAAWIGFLLAAGVGVPYVAVTTASPVLQRWYASLGQPDSDNPYFLYAASNAGSLLGLLAFPFLLEPRLTTTGQERSWLVGFLAYLCGIAACSWLVGSRSPGRYRVDARTEPELVGVGRLRALRWVAIAAVPTALMLGVTTYLTTDVASAPLLWVVPLALYLVSFMVTFGRRVHVSPPVAGIAAALSVGALVLVELERIEVEQLARTCVHLVAMFTTATLAHAVLHAERPPARQLTTFYLLLSLGGAIGGSFTALLAPLAFDDVHEYPVLLAAALLLRRAPFRRLQSWLGSGARRAVVTLVELLLVVGLLLLLVPDATHVESEALELEGAGWAVAAGAGLLLLALRRWGMLVVGACLLGLLTVSPDDDALLRERNFFGTISVQEVDGQYRLLHGTTLHGSQFRATARRDTPTTYYSRRGPLGDVFEHLQRQEPFVEVGAVGLGTGSVAAYARLWQRFTFFEIDPAVIRIARDPDLFTWLSDADVDIRVVEGDARLRLQEERDDRFDLLVLDAYSSDAVPVHLLTTEAFELYLEKLAPGGRMAVHISSRHLDLEPVVAANAQRLGLASLGRADAARLPEQVLDDATGSHWIVLARDRADLAPLAGRSGWYPLVEAGADEAWTDDFSNVAATIEWLPGN